jgi:uncharacterized protein (DUF2336 family)
MEFQKNKPSPQGLRIIALCHAHPGSSVEMLAELSGLPHAEVHAITKTQRNNGNLATAKRPDGSAVRACYIATPKGCANAGIADPAKVEQRTPPSHYTKLVPIAMVSHRPGAWAANAIASRGQAC